jgi:TonB-linked SusC/RagA family outer membrane protein
MWIAGLVAMAGIWLASGAYAQAPGDARISGTVTATVGTPISGATVSIVSLHLGTTTREDGTYAFFVPAGLLTAQPVSLNARSIGFKEKNADIVLKAGPNPQDFALEVNPLKLGEVVVTGEGTTSATEKLGNSRSGVTAPEIQKSNEPNITTALAGKAPGVEVTSTSGDPGSATQITIRGINTLGGGEGRPSSPLFVVDGVPIDNSSYTTSFLDPQASTEGGAASPNRAIDINPDDIASIEILKGAAAGAIFGARAGQGVILITTKHGGAGQTRYSLNSSYSFDNANKFPKLQRSYGQGDAGAADPCAAGTAGVGCSATSDSWGPAIAAGTRTFDHASEAFVQGHLINNTLTVSGGNERTTFYASGSYTTQSGTVIGPNNYLKRSSVRLAAEHRVFDKLKIGGNVTVAQTKQGGVQKGFNFSSITWTSDLTPPDFNNLPFLSPTVGLQRSYRYPFPAPGSDLLTRGFDDPFWSALRANSTTTTPRTLGDIHAEYDPLSWLKLTYQLGGDNADDSRLQGQDQSNSNSLDPGGQVLLFDVRHTQINQDMVATASYSASSDLAGTVVVGNNLNSLSVYQSGVVGDVLLAPGLYSINNTLRQRPAFSLEQHQRVVGFFTQETLDLWQQLYLKGGLRYDGASTYSLNNLWAWFPSVSAAWEFTKKTGTIGPIGYGKLRAAYGQVGTQPAPYLYDNIYSPTRQFTNGYGGLFVSPQGMGGLARDSVAPGVNLRPERTAELEGGFDLALFGNLSDLNFTLYRRLSTDVILAAPVAASSGYKFVNANGAVIQNLGGELGINIRPITTRNLEWTVGLSGGVNHNRVNSLLGADFVSYGGSGGFFQVFSQVGNSVDAFRDHDYVRCGRGVTLFQGTNPYSVDAHCTGAQNRAHALFITDGTLANSNGDPGDGPGFPLLDPISRLIGNPDPKWSGSISNSLRLGKLTVSALVHIRRGGLVYNGTRAVTSFYGTSAATALRGHTVVFGTNYLPGVGSGHGPVAGPGAGTPATLDQNWWQVYDGGISPSPIGAPFYEDGSFTKLREVSLTYALSGPTVTRLGLSTVDLRVSGRNLFTWSGYTGSDPEVNIVGSETGAHGIDFFGDPQTRSVVLTVILNR